MVPFSEIVIGLDRVVGWIGVGMAAGLLVAFATKGGRYGPLGDVVAALAGAVLGGVLFVLLTPVSTGVGGSILVAFFGACVLIVLLRVVARGGTRL
jgi:uncharacterized membrane protein YeaQ/YmgE (transglycosylase-associated protein family)